jgi:hydrogenase maturation protein HypF
MTRHISIKGVVQGVGFRPFVYGLAARMDLRGWVCNTSEGVEIEVQGHKSKVEDFLQRLTTEIPPLARIDSITVRDVSSKITSPAFEIRTSINVLGGYQPISPDIAICADCEYELFDPGNRRYLYPFINCTNCGPRFTIIKDTPYDRPKTTMADFPMCADCNNEYQNPLPARSAVRSLSCEK